MSSRKIHSIINDAYYVLVLRVIVLFLLSIILTKIINGVTIEMFARIDRTNLWGFILSKFDLFYFWFCLVLGFSMSNVISGSTKKIYIMTIFVLWILSIISSFVLIKTLSIPGILFID